MTTSKEIYGEIEKALGVVPSFVKHLEGDTYALSHEWELIKKFVLGESEIPAKYRELTAIAVAAAIHCRFCVTFHTAIARLYGATDEEIREAAYLAKFTTGWSSFVDGTLSGIGQLEGELKVVKDHMSKKAA